jgi:hypothetical protein
MFDIHPVLHKIRYDELGQNGTTATQGKRAALSKSATRALIVSLAILCLAPIVIL